MQSIPSVQIHLSSVYSSRVSQSQKRIESFGWWLYDRLLGLADSLEQHIVVLPWDAEIDWPLQCHVCSREPSDTTIPVSVPRIGTLSIAIGIEAFWNRRTFHVPVCFDCHRRCVRRTWLRRIVPPLVLVTLLLSGIALARWLHPIAPAAAYIIHIAAVLGSIIIAIILGLAFGWPIDITAKEKQLHIEFKTKELAEAFAAANGAVVES